MPSLMLPKISVITPVLNGAKTLDRTIQSLLNQRYPSLEYIILDAGSTDGTLDIIKKYEPQISFWRSYPDGGTAPAHNEGIRRATGDIIAFLNADDWYEPDVLHQVCAAFAEAPDLEVVNCLAQIKRGETVEVIPERLADFSPNRLPIPIPNARFIRKSLYEKLGPFIEHFEGYKILGFDMEYIWRVHLAQPQHRFIPIIAYTYVVHEDSMTFNSRDETKVRLAKEGTLFSLYYLKNKHLNAAWQKEMRKNIRRNQLLLVKKALKKRAWTTVWAEWKTGYQVLGWRFMWLVARKMFAS
jgi:glycosyltransferase involved in cell wall biosynthesis